MIEAIPGPRGLPLLGNIAEFGENPTDDIDRLADKYGEIYRLKLPGLNMLMLSSNRLVNEVCDEKRFCKAVGAELVEMRHAVRDALFTAYEGEPNWEKAHRILVPAFGPVLIRNMFDEMHEICAQMCLKFARHGPTNKINTSEEFTRLALDTLALCSMNYRFNSFYRDDLHPFVKAMGDFLTECGNRTMRPKFMHKLLPATRKWSANIGILTKTANEVVEERRRNPGTRKDLLTAMLDGVDPKTGEKLTTENITHQLITFLVAGHETTSGTLSFAFCLLLQHPDTYNKVQEEVDRVIGRNPMTVDHLTKLPYISAVLRETLRLSSPIPGFLVQPRKDTILGGKYPVKEGELLLCVLSKAHLDPYVYGDDAKEFKPERMLDDNFALLNKNFPNAWKPFGNGKRACIGRPFVWQEAVLAMAMLFQNFEFTMDDPNYKLQIKETLTRKPDGFVIHATMRHGVNATELERSLTGGGGSVSQDPTSNGTQKASSSQTGSEKPLAVYFGSNSGTCEALAQRLAADAPMHGFRASTVSPLDSAAGKLPSDRPVVIITASYEGQPPSNAAKFISWLEGKSTELKSPAPYAVFACGHRDWSQTFHRIPLIVDSRLSELGGARIAPMGCSDAAEGDMFGDFESWEDSVFWPALEKRYGITGSREDASGATDEVQVEVSVPRTSTLAQDLETATVLSTRSLTNEAPLKKHIEIQLPESMQYTAGDYLAVLPQNNKATVSRVFRRFQLPRDSVLKIISNRPLALPFGETMLSFDIFSSYVELNQLATKRNIAALASATSDDSVRGKLEKLANEDYLSQIAAKKVSILDLLEEYPSISISVGSFLTMLPPMRARQYSISSSPMADPSRVTLTYSVIDEPSLSGNGRYLGVATNFLSDLSPGEKLQVAVRESASAFRLPSDAENTPIICIAAGSGLAPFKGFLEERATMLASGRKLAPALLFFGCRDPDMDDIYSEELRRWEEMGCVSVRRAYSRACDRSLGCKYVQDRLYKDSKDILGLWERGAKVYVCGSRAMSKGVEDSWVRLVAEAAGQSPATTEAVEVARRDLEQYRNARYATDVFD